MVNGPAIFGCDESVRSAMDFWYKAGYSSSDAVFGVKQVAVCESNVNDYFDYKECSDEEKDDYYHGGDRVQNVAKSDWKRRQKRSKERRRKLKFVNHGIEKILQELGKQGQNDNNDNDMQ